jgi:hypothetical protein
MSGAFKAPERPKIVLVLALVLVLEKARWTWIFARRSFVGRSPEDFK